MTRGKKIIIGSGIVLIIIMIAAGAFSLNFYNKILKPNVSSSSTGHVFYIPTGSTFENVLDTLIEREIIVDSASFRWVAGKMNYPGNIRSGKYRIKAGTSNRELVGKLRMGAQEHINLVLSKRRTKESFAGFLSKHLELDSISMLEYLNNAEYLTEIGYNTENVMSLFLLDTYEIYWNTSSEKFIERMLNENKRFWNADRLSKADYVGLSPTEVIILASIIDEETSKDDEKDIIARLYLNRIDKGMLLQADPTLKFAHQDFTLQRVLDYHKQIDSPYNTYMYIGLPPGPICLPGKASIQAVLNPDNNDYIFMCAKEDFSGYHNFAKTNAQHERNRQKYIAALNERSIN